MIMIVCKGLLALCALLLFTIALMGQNVSKQYCKQIESSIIRPLNPMKINNRIVFKDECWFEFTLEGEVEVSLSIEKHDTEEESHESLDRTLSLTASFLGLEGKEELSLDKLDTNNNWDEVYFSKATKINSGSLLLRKGKVAIEMLSRKDEILVQMEKLLRDKIGRKLAVVPTPKN